jgi:hypothetical protein
MVRGRPSQEKSSVDQLFFNVGGSVHDRCMDDLATPLGQAKAALAVVAAAPPHLLADDDLAATIVGVEEVGRLLDAARVLLAAEAERRSEPALGDESLARRAGHRKAQHWLETLTGASPIEVARRLRIGVLLLPRPMFDGELVAPAFPAVAEGVRDGRIGLDAAESITRQLQQAARRHAPVDDLAAAEHDLADDAGRLPYWEVDLHAKVWREVLDPDGAKPREDELQRNREFRLGRERNGMTPFSGLAPPAEAALLRAAFGEAAAPDRTPRFVGPEDLDEGGTDTRTTAQRHFDILVGFFRAGMRAPMAQRSTATVVATVKLEELASGRGVAWLEDVTEPISAFAAQVMACANGFETLVVGQHGQPLALGPKERYFTPAQRRAIAARDGGAICCDTPPSWADAHHVRWWCHGGPTDVDNGVLLCPRHHTEVHEGRFEIRMVNGRPQIRYPLGDWKPAGRSRVLMTRSLTPV